MTETPVFDNTPNGISTQGKENKKNVRILKSQKSHNNMINDKLDNVIDYEEINYLV